jgi:hypothetical protein
VRRVIVLWIVCAAGPASAQVTELDRSYLSALPWPGLDFESAVDATPDSQPDRHGVGLAGASSLENTYIGDDLTTNGVLLPVSATPILLDFVETLEVHRDAGIVRVVTRRGRDEVAGSVFAYLTPAAASVDPAGDLATSIEVHREVGHQLVIGTEVGGPIVRDHAWWWVGFAPAETTDDVVRTTRRRVDLDRDGRPDLGADGAFATEALDRRHLVARTVGLDLIGRVDVAVTPEHQGGIELIVQPRAIEDVNALGKIDEQEREAHLLTTDAIAHWRSRFGRTTVGAALGMHREDGRSGSRDGARDGVPLQILYGGDLGTWARLGGESTATGRGCTDGGGDDPYPLIVNCPDTGAGYAIGGPGSLVDESGQRVEAHLVGAHEVRHHELGLAVDATHTTYDTTRRYSGDVWFQNFVGSSVDAYRWVEPTAIHADASEVAARVSDRWQVRPDLVIDAANRLDAQRLGDELAVDELWAPSGGIVYDPTGEGRARVWLRGSRHTETLPLSVAVRLPQQPWIETVSFLPRECGPVVNGIGGADANACRPSPDVDHFPSTPPDPIAVDPSLRSQGVRDLFTGGEVELEPGVIVGATFEHRAIRRVIEDAGAEDGTLRITNPPDARRDHDAVSFTIERRAGRGVGVRASYTYARTAGNYPGLDSPDSGQTEPNLSSQFDLPETEANRDGPLPQDRRHTIAIDGTYAHRVGPGAVGLGARFRATSGAPVDVLAAHSRYGQRETFLLPRGAAGRTPFLGDLSIRLGWSQPLSGGMRLEIFADLLHALDPQGATAVDERYTFDAVAPIVGGTFEDLIWAHDGDGGPIARNPGFGRASARQLPATLRLGARISF